MLDVPAGAPAAGSLPALASIADTSATIEDRARDYLHANCAFCHRPGGPTFTPLDLRFETSLHSAGICNQLPTIDDLAALIPADPRIFAPGAPDRSVLWHRMYTTDKAIRMPPIARSLTDTAAASVISTWITATPTCP